MVHHCLALLLLPILVCQGHLEVYPDDLSAPNRSVHYSATLIHGSKQYSAMVYTSHSPDKDLARLHPGGLFCTLHGRFFCNRTISWLEFGQTPTDTTTITITNLQGHFPSSTRVLPLSYGLSVTLSDSGRLATVTVTGSIRHFSMDFGHAPAGSFQHALYVFVGEPDPVLPSNASNVLYYGPGVHHVPGIGIQQLPDAADTIYIARGAWVAGRINVTRGHRGSVKVLGHGVMDGSRFTYHGSKFVDDMRFIEIQYDRPLMYDGPTLVHPQGHAMFAPPNSVIRSYRMLGWLYNEDGLWIGDNTTLTDAFIRTNDDAIRLYAGALDDFHNRPAPPRNRPARNIHVDRCVVAQSFNGGVIQVGWEDTGIVDSVVEGVDVIAAEWFWTGGNLTGKPNDGVLSLRGPTYDITLQEHHRNLTMRRVNVDVPVGRVIGLGFFGTPNSTVEGVILEDITVREPLRWLPAGTADIPGSNYLCALPPDSITSVSFVNITVAGVHVKRHTDWDLSVIGAVSGVSYS